MAHCKFFPWEIKVAICLNCLDTEKAKYSLLGVRGGRVQFLHPLKNFYCSLLTTNNKLANDQIKEKEKSLSL